MAWADSAQRFSMGLARPSPLPERGEELGQRHVESRGEPAKSTDPDVPFAAFDAAYIVSMKVGSRGKFFLRDSEFPSQLPNSAPNGAGQVSSHADDRPSLNTIGLHTIVFISWPLPARSAADAGPAVDCVAARDRFKAKGYRSFGNRFRGWPMRSRPGTWSEQPTSPIRSHRSPARSPRQQTGDARPVGEPYRVYGLIRGWKAHSGLDHLHPFVRGIPGVPGDWSARSGGGRVLKNVHA